MYLKNISDEFCKLILNTSPQLQGDNKPIPNEFSMAGLLFEFLQKLILDYEYQRNTAGLICKKISLEFKYSRQTIALIAILFNRSWITMENYEVCDAFCYVVICNK